MLTPTAFRAKVRGSEYRKANDPQTELWRVCVRVFDPLLSNCCAGVTRPLCFPHFDSDLLLHRGVPSGSDACNCN
jgi:hypothetical protein